MRAVIALSFRPLKLHYGTPPNRLTWELTLTSKNYSRRYLVLQMDRGRMLASADSWWPLWLCLSNRGPSMIPLCPAPPPRRRFAQMPRIGHSPSIHRLSPSTSSKRGLTACSFQEIESSTSVPTTQIAEIGDFNCHGPAQTPPLNFRSNRGFQKPQKPILLSGTRALTGLDKDSEGKFW